MTFSKLSKFVSAGVLAAGLTMMPLTASAQTGTGTGTGTDTTTDTTTQSQGVDNTADRGDRDFDWGWLGLLGLIGLAGLTKRNEPVRYREPDEVGSSTYRS